MTPTTSADTNLFLYAANRDSPRHDAAARFLSNVGRSGEAGDVFVVCELVLVELYLLLRNPKVLARPLRSAAAATFCNRLRANAAWQHVDYDPAVSKPLWNWAEETSRGFRHIIDARLALTLRHHGVTRFATANVKHFDGFGFEKVWDPSTSSVG